MKPRGGGVKHTNTQEGHRWRCALDGGNRGWLFLFLGEVVEPGGHRGLISQQKPNYTGRDPIFPAGEFGRALGVRKAGGAPCDLRPRASITRGRGQSLNTGSGEGRDNRPGKTDTAMHPQPQTPSMPLEGLSDSVPDVISTFLAGPGTDCREPSPSRKITLSAERHTSLVLRACWVFASFSGPLACGAVEHVDPRCGP
ncbi:hypothetical protein AAFF_G00255870 [Aldrovandia affinis]|uniref:Uncharacterized protein n=1 Tax=Aldrovandia affinis TaxID=143900 RepID=A0AAD7W2A3_9TELE|nr:hypothetical protein AAFF_G00255870 [Aldrovandia affinis]